MPALPRPDLPPGAHRDLVEALHDLHHRAGWPSLRTLAQAAGCSHTTVSTVFSSPRLPAWGNVEVLVEAMNGDTQQLHDLWLAASTPAMGATARLPAAIAGRRTELAAVRRHLESGTGLLVVSGEAGIGKSRLLSAAAGAVDGPVAVGACLPLSQAVPLMPVADALASAFASDDGARVARLLAGGPAYLRSALARLLPELDARSGPEPDQRQVFVAVEQLLVGPGPPLPLVLDDLHWADPATLDLLEHLVARDAPVTLLGTWRLDDPAVSASAQDWWQRIRRLPATATLALGPLDRAATAEQIERLGVTLSPVRVDRVFERSGGRPLFTEQLAVHGGDTLPDLLADLLDRRLGDLGDDAAAVASRLGVADRPLAVTDLAELTGLPTARLDAALHDLADRFLLHTSSTEVTLRHPLLAEAARDRLLPHERLHVHRDLAEHLGAGDAPAAEVAEHWRAAGDAAEELFWRERAAQAASTRGATGQAGTDWLRVLELWPPDLSRTAAAHANVLVQALTCLSASSRIEEAFELVSRALALLPELDASAAAPLLTSIGSVQGALLGPEEAMPVLRRAVALHEELPASGEQVRALAQLAGQLRGMGRFDEARALVARAVAVSEQIDDGTLLRHHLELLAWHETVAGDPVTAAATRARAEAVVGDTPPDLIGIGVIRTDALLVSCAPCTEVEAAAAPGLALARDEGISSHALTLLQSNTAQALIRSGRLSVARELLEPVTHVQPGVDNWPVFIEWMWLLCLSGDADRATGLLVKVESIPITAATNQAERAERAAVVDLWRATPASAKRRLRIALEAIGHGAGSLRAGGLLTLLAWAVAELAEGGADARAAESLRRVRRSLAHDPLAAHAVSGDRAARARQWDAELHRVEGRSDPASWAAAATEWDGLGRPNDAAYCRWRGAQAALAAGQGTVARRMLKRAATDAREHVPLTRAIAETGASAQNRERA